MNIPVLLCVYRRLEKVQILLSALRTIKPSVLYVSANAPKNKNEKIYCDAIKNAIAEIDWDCTIHKKYETVHIPDCSASITNGINWFFSNVEYGIILEDDCIPVQSFFDVCTTLLHKYKDDDSVFQIAGANINYDHDAPPHLLNSFFSLPPWGWATWKERWEKYTPQMNNWREAEDLIKENVQDFAFWENLLDSNEATKAGWDIQWNVDIWVNKGKILMPSYNLITNVGFDDLATFTFNSQNALANLPTKEFILAENNEIFEASNHKLEKILINCFKTLRHN